MKQWIPWMAAMLMTACASTTYRPGSVAGYQNTLSSWTGRSSQDLIHAWGTPIKVQTLRNDWEKYTWSPIPFGPRLTFASDCATSAIIDSSGTVVSWTSKGSDCRLAYSDDALKKNHDELLALCSTLPKNQAVRLKFYNDAENRSTGRKFGKTYKGYFSRCSTVYDTVAISESPPGLFQSYPMEYPLSLVEDISVIGSSSPTPVPTALPAATEKTPESIHVDCSSEGGSHLRLVAGGPESSFVIQSDHGLLHCRLEALHLACDLPTGDHLTATLRRDDPDGVRINDCEIKY
jgi:hypothetical protein